MKGDRQSGYTLTEIVVTLSIFTLLSAGLYMFFLHNLGTSYMTAGKLLVSGDIRKFTSELTVEARNASYFHLYRSYSDSNEVLRDSSSGDLLVLYFLDSTGALERSVGYYRAADAGEVGPVRRFDSRESGFDPAQLPPLAQLNSFPVLIQLSRGLADGRLFFNFYDRSVLIRGEIVHSGNLRSDATNTYNFTVSPRG